VIGAIADDFTGATDIASALVESGLATQLVFDPRAVMDRTVDSEALVVALKTRSGSTEAATRLVRQVAAELRRRGCDRLYFKYCSTFDSTPTGNIGPVANVLLEATDSQHTVVCPAYPSNGRTIYCGHLFVEQELLSESSMRDHPLTPMRDSSLIRLMDAQSKRTVGLVPLDTVRQGPQAVRAALASARDHGICYSVVDALTDGHLDTLAAATIDFPLVTGAAGLAAALGRVLSAGAPRHESPTKAIGGMAAIVAGSASEQTRRQVEHFATKGRTLSLDPCRGEREQLIAAAITWAQGCIGQEPILVAVDSSPDAIAALQARHGREEAGVFVESVLAEVAARLVALGVRRLLVAGGETSGAVMARLGIASVAVGNAIAPGVPWTYAAGPMAIALKSGNFGPVDLFSQAFERLPTSFAAVR
jgi:uncharacterized protein YgbK (DUF1537 family)